MFTFITELNRRFPLDGPVARRVLAVVAVLSVIALAAEIYFIDEVIAFLTEVTR